MEEAAPVAEHPMRHQLNEEHRVDVSQHPALEQDQPAVLEHPHLALVFVLEISRRLFEGVRLGLVHGAATPLHHQVREREVVAEPWVDLHVVSSP